MRFSLSYFTSGRTLLGIVFLIGAINPFTEIEEFRLEPLFMASHYLLFIAGFLLAGRMRIAGPFIALGIFLVVLWHIPFFYALAAAYPAWRILNDLSLLTAGILSASSSRNFPAIIRLLLFVAWMGADSVLSVVLIVGWPPYSSQVYPFSPFAVTQELPTGLTMFGIMTAIFVYVILTLLKSIFKI